MKVAAGQIHEQRVSRNIAHAQKQRSAARVGNSVVDTTVWISRSTIEITNAIGQSAGRSTTVVGNGRICGERAIDERARSIRPATTGVAWLTGGVADQQTIIQRARIG